jgi:hypothetical protein
MEEWIDEVLPPAAGDYVGLFGEDDVRHTFIPKFLYEE